LSILAVTSTTTPAGIHIPQCGEDFLYVFQGGPTGPLAPPAGVPVIARSLGLTGDHGKYAPPDRRVWSWRSGPPSCTRRCRGSGPARRQPPHPHAGRVPGRRPGTAPAGPYRGAVRAPPAGALLQTGWPGTRGRPAARWMVTHAIPPATDPGKPSSQNPEPPA